MRQRDDVSLGKTLYTISPLNWGQAVYPLWWPSLTKNMQTKQLLCWSGMTDTENNNIWFKRRRSKYHYTAWRSKISYSKSDIFATWKPDFAE